MDVIYDKVARFDEKMDSGLMEEKYSQIQIESWDSAPLLDSLNTRFKTNLNAGGIQISNLELLIWLPDEEGDPNSFQVTINDRYSLGESATIVKEILTQLTKHAEIIKRIRVSRDCEVDSSRVEQFLLDLQEGDVFENILENISKLCLIDSETYNNNKRIALMIDEMEKILFEELVNRKIRVNGKGGILREVPKERGHYGFFERGVRKNYMSLSLVQKMGAKTIREIGF